MHTGVQQPRMNGQRWERNHVHTGVQQPRMDGQRWERYRVHTGVPTASYGRKTNNMFDNKLSVLYIHCCFQSCSGVDERK